MSKKIIIITGASSGFGSLAARALADAGHTVNASMRETTGRNAAQVKAVEEYAAANHVDIRAIELDAELQKSADEAIQRIVTENGRLDVVIHNAGHMVFGPAEAFPPEQLAELYDVNVVSIQRVNRAALPQLRKQRRGLLVWVSSSSATGEHLLTWLPTSRRKLPWTRRQLCTPATSLCGASRPPSSFQELLRPGQIISRTRAHLTTKE
jgi:NAD(P)-dependent dehydrogenase (short-subunit alcohol dehydrogenase family)